MHLVFGRAYDFLDQKAKGVNKNDMLHSFRLRQPQDSRLLKHLVHLYLYENQRCGSVSVGVE